MALTKLGLVDCVVARETVHHLLTEGARGLKDEGDCAEARGISCPAIAGEPVLGPRGCGGETDCSGLGKELLLHGVDDRDI